jgi:hypothetical protein
MAGNGAQRIRQWLVQNEVGTWMQSGVKMGNPSENIDRNDVLVLCFLDNFVPEFTEVML